MPHASPPSAHTPGPWFADLVDLIIYTSGDTASKIAVVHQQLEPSEDSDVTSSNARLIAAAPDLLKLARSFRCSCGERLSILREERNVLWMQAFETDDIDDQIGHWTTLQNTCDAVIAQATVC
jgi:hypothetical protein